MSWRRNGSRFLSATLAPAVVQEVGEDKLKSAPPPSATALLHDLQNRRFEKLPGERTWRSATGWLECWCHRRSYTTREHYLPLFVADDQNICRRDKRRWTLPFPRRGLLIARLPDAVSAVRRFFHFGAHGPKVVGGRNHREEDDQQASQGQQTVQGTELADRVVATPEPPGWKRQQQPGQIEQKLHQSLKNTFRCEELGRMNNLVFQKLQI